MLVQIFNNETLSILFFFFFIIIFFFLYNEHINEKIFGIAFD